MADISSTIKQDITGHEFQSPYQTRVYEWDPVNDGTSGTGTHNIAAIPEGFAFLQGAVVVTEAFTSAGSATVKFLTGEADFTGAVPKADLTIGEVFKLEQNLAINATEGAPYYVDGTTVTAETIDVTVGTAALTAGKAKLVIDLIDISRIQAAV